MAFAPDDPNAPQNQNPANNPMAQPPQTASGIGAGAGGVSSPQGITATLSATKAPPVTNLGDYLKANAPQAQGMADTIAGKLNEGFSTIQNDLTAGKDAFEGKVNAGTVAPDPSLVSRAAASPTDFIMSPDDIAAFQRQMNASYTGPQDFSSSDVYSRLSSEVQKAAQNAPNPNNPDDLRSTVTGIENNPTPGMTTLDTLLLQGTPGAAQTVNAARTPYGTLTQTLQDTATGEDAAAANARALTATTAPAAVAPFTGPGGVVPKFSDDLMSRVTKASQDAGAAGANMNAITLAIQNNNLTRLTPDQLATLGMTPDDAKTLQALYDISVQSYSTAPAYAGYYTPGELGGTPASPQNVATPQDYSTEAALEMLLGGGLNLPISQSTSSMAGTFSPLVKNPSLNGESARSGIGTELKNRDIATINQWFASSFPGQNMPGNVSAAYHRLQTSGYYGDLTTSGVPLDTNFYMGR